MGHSVRWRDEAVRDLKGLFVYETPHPAHRTWADAIGCEMPGTPALTRPGLVGPFRSKAWYRRLARNPVLVRRTIEATASSFEPPATAPDIVLFEGWRQTACARHFPGSFKVLIGADWFPFVFRQDARMLEYLRPFDLIVSASEVHASYIPAAVNPRIRVVHPAVKVVPSPLGEGPDCAFVGDVVEDLKGVPRSVELFERAFDDGRVFHVIGACDPSLTGRRFGNVLYHGRVPDDLMAELLGRCRYYLHWAVFDAYAVTTVEAMAHGLIPITSPTTGTHYLSVQVLGEGFDLTSIEAAAAALRRLDAGGGWRELRGRCQEISRGLTVEASAQAFREAVLSEHERWAAGKGRT